MELAGLHRQLLRVLFSKFDQREPSRASCKNYFDVGHLLLLALHLALHSDPLLPTSPLHQSVQGKGLPVGQFSPTPDVRLT